MSQKFKPAKRAFRVCGAYADSFFFCRGYCQQLDTHVPTATVREALLFSAMLRQPKSVSLAEKEA